MSADNSCTDVLVPLRNLANAVKCVRDRVQGKIELIFSVSLLKAVTEVGVLL